MLADILAEPNRIGVRPGAQVLCDFAAQQSAHPQVTAKPGRRKLSDIKMMKDDPAAVESQAEQIKTRYLQIFKV